MNYSVKSNPASCNIKKVSLHLIGTSGKMGQVVQELVRASSDLETGDAESADIFLDFSSPEGALYALEMAERLRKPLVSGTTGLSPPHFERMRQAAQKIALLHSPNFSIGIAALFLAAEGLQHLPGRSIAIRETHHTHKKDAPSGTALKLQELLEGAPISWERKGEVVGEHEIVIRLADEELIFKHVAHSRRVFAHGALLAVRFLLGNPPGLYSFKEAIVASHKNYG